MNKKNILLVEDEILLAMIEKQELENAGYNVIHVISGEKAIDLAASESIDLILMDINLGNGLDGTEAAKEILKNRDIPVVFLSSHTEREIVSKTEKITSYGYVVKNSGIIVLDTSLKMAFKLFEANKKKEEQKEQLRTILASIDDAVIAADTRGNIIQMNPVSEALTGWKQSDACGRRLNEVLKVMVIKDTAANIYGQYSMVSKNGNEFRISYSESPIKDADGNNTGTAVVFRDITGEYDTQKKIEKSEKLYRSLFENMLNCFAYCKIIHENDHVGDFIFLSVNKSFETYSGLIDPAGKKASELIPSIKDSDPELFKLLERVCDKGIPEFKELYISSLKIWISLSVYGTDKDYFVMVFDIITDRKKIEDELVNSRNFLMSIIDQSPFPTWISDENGTLIKLNRACRELLDITEDDVIGKYNIMQDDIVVSQGVLPLVRRVFEKGDTVNFELSYDSSQLKHLHLERTVKVVLKVTIFPIISSSGKITNAVIQHNNITGIKNIEFQIEEKQKFLKSFTKISPDILYLYNIKENKYNFIDKTVFNIAGFESDGNFSYDSSGIMMLIHPDDVSKYLAHFNTIINSGRDDIYFIEFRIKNKSGEYIWLNVHDTVYQKDNNGRPEIIFGIIQDVSEFKTIENELRKNEYLFKLSLKHAPVTVAAQDMNLRFLWAYNQRTAENHDIIGKTDRDLFLPEEADKLISLKKKVMETGTELNDMLCLLRSGKPMYLDLYIEPMRNEKDEITGVGIATVDLTPLKMTESSLKKSEEKYRRLYESMMDAYVTVDLEGHIKDFNNSFRTLLGYEEDELIGKTFFEITPDCWHELDRKIISEQIMPKGYSEVYEKEYFKKCGDKIPVELRKFLVRDDDGNPFGIWAIVRDITERKIAETRINNLLHEKDLILKEVHHRIKNNMGIVSSLINIQANSQENELVKKILSDASGRIQSMKILYDKLYRSSNITSVSIKDYFPALINEIKNLFPNRSSVRIETSIDEIILDSRIVTPLGIIINELLNNSMKYAFEDIDDGCIYFTVEKKDGLAVLTYMDNGKGIPDTVTFEKSTGFGMKLVWMLVQQLDGKIKIEREKGTKFIIELGTESK